MTPDELVEKVARVLASEASFDPDEICDNHTPTCPGPVWRLYVGDARAAIAVLRPLLRAEALEQAAKIAEETGTFELCAPDEGTYTVWTARKTAAAIRNLIGEK